MFSGLHHTGVACAVWEPDTPYGSRYDICEEDGIIWGQNVTYGGHMEAERAGWELCVLSWSYMAPCGRHMAPYGGCMCHVMATWELCALYRSHVCYLGAVCTI
jgi:hypothetical protein